MKAGEAPVDCVILAAGASTRMGRPKLHLPFALSTILGTTVDTALRAGCRVIVVGRPGDGSLAALSSDRVLVAWNPCPDEGMISTLWAGLEYVLAERFFFVPGDMPLVSPATWKLLLATRSDGPVIPTFRGRRGHPVLMPSSLIPAILALEAGLTLKVLIAASGPVLVETCDEGVVTDIDDPVGYEAALAGLHSTLG